MKAQFRKYIEQFWKGSLNEEEQQRLLVDLMEQEEKLKTELQDEFGQGAIENEELLTEERYAEILTEVHQKMGVIKSVPKSRIAFRQWAAAAAVLICLGLGAYLLLFRNEAAHMDQNQQATVDTINVINSDGVDKRATLPDGSSMILSSGSKLSYTADYGKSNRSLMLSGKARFRVIRDTIRPFVVLANGYTTTALGTEFTVDTQLEDMVKVALLSGRIVVKATSNSAVTMDDQYMEPGEELHIHIKDRSIKRKITWQNARLHSPSIANKPSPPRKLPVALNFEDAPLEEVFEAIAKQKNVSINTGNARLGGLSFTGDFSPQESIQVMLQIVCQMNGLTYREEGNTIWIE